MPFIDLNNTNNNSNQNAAPTANNSQGVSNNNGGTYATQQGVQMTIDPNTGVREIKGEDFPAPATPLAPSPAVASPTPEPNPAPPANTPVLQAPAPQQQQQQQPVPETKAAPPTEPQTEPPAPEPQPETELVLGTNKPAEPPQDQAMQDVMDRSLPELEKPTGQAEIPADVNPEIMRKLKMEEDLESLKTPEEKVALDSKNYGLDDLLHQTVNLGASDLHLSAGYRAMARVDGKLQTIKSQILNHEGILSMLQNIVAGSKHIDLKNDKDIDLSYALPEADARFRVNIGHQQGSVMATFRLIPKHIRTPEELRLPPIVKEFTKYKQGLILVTGPTGSGKSTTLASLVNHINLNEPSHIITIEDPIEYTYPKGTALVDQRAVHIDTDSWSMALRAALRQDPDVVLIGEMRDTETMEAALQVAETGHLVFSTLHTNTAAQTIDRVIDAFPEDKQAQVRSQLAGVLMAVVSQRLLPVAGGGRRLSAEVMVVTAGIRNAIREGKVFQIDNMIQTGAELGMVTMEKSLANLVREGQISTEMAQRYANKPEDVLSLLGRK